MIDKKVKKKNYNGGGNKNDGGNGGGDDGNNKKATSGRKQLSDMVNHYDDVDDNGKKLPSSSKKNRKDDMTTASGFKSLGLSDDVHRGIIRMGFRNPTPVQRKAIPIILSGVDSVVMARTGSGKTLAFCIPLIEKLILLKSKNENSQSGGVLGIILSPTRELVQQTLRVFTKLVGQNDNPYRIRAIMITGSESMEQQFHMLSTKPDVIIATPGRFAHHITEIPNFTLSTCCMCILDEADRLFEMGFALQIRTICKSLPSTESSLCQKVLLSATMPKVLIDFTTMNGGVLALDNPTMIRLDNEISVSDELRMSFITCRSTDKDAALLHILTHIQDDKVKHSNQNRTGLTLIFAATRHHVEYICTLLSSAGYYDQVTMIYGTLDQEARKEHLHAFKRGIKSILVVTDVAARGIDVPFIDHVIHYHFPSSSKLFIHRSGRAARAGRIGFCWSLVEPDELSYMIDLHVFLGYKPRTAHDALHEIQQKDKQQSSNSHDNNNDDVLYNNNKNQKVQQQQDYIYTLDEMTPDMVHYGSLPESIACMEVENVQRILNSELSSSKEAVALQALTKVCKNAMKQYRRTRPEPSKDAIRRAKAILEGERQETGQRIFKDNIVGTIPPHPLLRSAEIKYYNTISERRMKDNINNTDNPNSTTIMNNNNNGINSIDNFRKREEFLDQMSKFRPKETVFEAFATGTNKNANVMSQIDKGRTTNTNGGNNKKIHQTAALAIMKNMRRQMKIAHDRGTSLFVAGTEHNNNDVIETNQQLNNKETNDDDDDDDGEVLTKNPVLTSLISSSVDKPIESKRPLSKIERKRMKMNSETSGQNNSNNDHHHHNNNNDHNTKKKLMRGDDYRDQIHFIENNLTSNTEDAVRSRHIEAAMQPSSASTNKGAFGHALRMEEALLDIVGDENEELVKRQRMIRWDKSKRKYVQTTIGSELSGDSKSKRTRLESGQVMKSSKLKLGELYDKWTKRTNRSIGRDGVFDDNNNNTSNNEDGGDNITPTKQGRNMMKKNQKGGGSNSSKNNGDDNDKMKSSMEIKKERTAKYDMKIKNMKKSDRTRFENNKKKNSSGNKSPGTFNKGKTWNNNSNKKGTPKSAGKSSGKRKR